MAGYTRQHAVSIVADALIIASDLSDEFDAVQSAFSEVSGHAHHGAGDGAAIVFLGPGSELQATATTLQPAVTNVMSIGTTGLRFKDAWFQGVVTAAGGFAGALTGNVTGNASTATTLATTRAISLTGAVTGSVAFNGSANVSLATSYNAVPATATALATARTIALTGAVTGSASFDGSANASITTTYATTPAILGANTFTAEQNFADNLLTRPLIKDYGVKANARGSITGAQTIDLTLGNYITATIAANTTFTFSNPTGGTDACGFVLKLTNAGAFTITWPVSVKWPAGLAPVLTSASGVDVLSFVTDDAGTTWRGVASMLDSR